MRLLGCRTRWRNLSARPAEAISREGVCPQECLPTEWEEKTGRLADRRKRHILQDFYIGISVLMCKENELLNLFPFTHS